MQKQFNICIYIFCIIHDKTTMYRTIYGLLYLCHLYNYYSFLFCAVKVRMQELDGSHVSGPCIFSAEVYHEEYDDGADQHPYGTGVAVSHVSMDLVIRTGYLQRS